MNTERYLAIMRPVMRDLLRVAKSELRGTPELVAYQFKSHYGVEGVTPQEYRDAVQWLVDALEHAQVIVRLDIKSEGGDAG